MKPRKGKPMVSRPYVPGQVSEPSASQHAIVRRLGPGGLWSPAFEEIMRAADEVAAELGKKPDELTDAEADRAIALGKQRHAESAT
ncbi:hypothetical protein [Streptomyces sp. NPDC093598]|uniref:hypothetical protein n=1 Tax=Streptomyces sp. NPDC093598 TaxID=3366046 RepID=UPI0037F46CA2